MVETEHSGSIEHFDGMHNQRREGCRFYLF
jgi:hypothetical protein